MVSGLVQVGRLPSPAQDAPREARWRGTPRLVADLEQVRRSVRNAPALSRAPATCRRRHAGKTRSPPYPTPARYSPCAGAVRPASDRGRPVEKRNERRHRPPAATDLEHRPDQHPDHLAHERVRLDPELEHLALGTAVLPPRREHDPREPLVIGLGRRERGEVVNPDQSRRALRQRRNIEPVRPPQRPPGLEHAPRPSSQNPIAVSPAGGVAPRVEPVSDRNTRNRRHIVRQQRIQRPQ